MMLRRLGEFLRKVGVVGSSPLELEVLPEEAVVGAIKDHYCNVFDDVDGNVDGAVDSGDTDLLDLSKVDDLMPVGCWGHDHFSPCS
jgi:hypothetical protein